MGGIGSGRRWHWSAKSTTDSMKKLDVRRLARGGNLAPGLRYGWKWTWDGEPAGDIQIETHGDHIRLNYRSREGGGEWESHSYSVRLLSTPCHLGGNRQWFACPARGCGKRVAILYGGRIFACRQCYDLAYPSQREERYQRLQRRASSIKSRLGWDDWTCAEWGPKPKGMHWRTFNRLTAQIDVLEGASDMDFVRYFHARFDHLID